MFAGHFGLAAGVRALESAPFVKKSEATARTQARKPEVPMWALMLSTQLLDVFFAVLLIPGIEAFGGPTGYGQGWIRAYYSHSLTGALLIALVAGLLGSRWWGRRGGLIVGGTVFSHWLLDLLVHRPDLPLLPGNIGNLPLLGFGLWNEPAISLTLEGILVVVGAVLYIISLRARTSGATQQQPTHRRLAILTGSVTSLLLVLALVTSALGLG